MVLWLSEQKESCVPTIIFQGKLAVKLRGCMLESMMIFVANKNPRFAGKLLSNVDTTWMSGWKLGSMVRISGL